MAVGKMDAAVGEVKFSLKEAFYLSLEQFKLRFGKMLLAMATVTLSIIFVVTFSVYSYFFQNLSGEIGLERQTLSQWYYFVILAMVVAIVSISNSLLMSVMERTKEIGTLKCLGALDSHILLLFLIEASLIGLVGGIVGFLLGMIASFASLYAQFGDLAFFIFSNAYQTLNWFWMAMATSVFLCIVASLYPARRAANLRPAEALRYEL